MTSTCIRVLLPDHTYTRLNRLRDDIKTFVAKRVTPDPGLNKVKVRYLGGKAGLYLAANDVLYRLDFLNITFVLAVIYFCCAFTFRSPVAGALFIISCVMAEFRRVRLYERTRYRPDDRHDSRSSRSASVSALTTESIRSRESATK